MERIRFRFFWVIAVLTTALVALCTITAVSLFREQARIAWVLQESVASRKAAFELEECLNGLIAQERDNELSVTELQARARELLQGLAKYADQPREDELYKNMTVAYGEHIETWKAAQSMSPPDQKREVDKAITVLTNVRTSCHIGTIVWVNSVEDIEL